MSRESGQEKLLLLSITIDVEGDFASRSELKLRKNIEDKILALKVGSCVGSGSGMGSMDTEFLIEDEEKARAAIDQMMAASFPHVEYELDVMVYEGSREDFEEEGQGCALLSPIGIIFLLLVLFGLYKLVTWIF